MMTTTCKKVNSWERLENIKKKWHSSYNKVYAKTFGINTPLKEPLHCKVKIAPATYKEYSIDGIYSEYNKFLNCKIVRLNISKDKETSVINVYDAFELKSDGKIVSVEVLFDMINSIINTVVSDIVIV